MSATALQRRRGCSALINLGGMHKGHTCAHEQISRAWTGATLHTVLAVHVCSSSPAQRSSSVSSPTAKPLVPRCLSMGSMRMCTQKRRSHFNFTDLHTHKASCPSFERGPCGRAGFVKCRPATGVVTLVDCRLRAYELGRPGLGARLAGSIASPGQRSI